MTTLAPVEIERICRTDEPSDSGMYREVWFLGDVVIKRDNTDGRTNQAEYNFYQEFTGGHFTVLGHSWEVRLPKTEMIGDYIVMERVRFPKLEVGAQSPIHGKWECNYCTYNHAQWEHESECFANELLECLDYYMTNAWGIYDIHQGNFMYDIYTRTVWVIDFAQ